MMERNGGVQGIFENTEYAVYSKTQNKRKIIEKGYTFIQSTPIA